MTRSSQDGANYNDKYLFIGGGFEKFEQGEKILDSVEIYDIDNNKWSSAPSMKVARYCLSYCVLG